MFHARVHNSLFICVGCLALCLHGSALAQSVEAAVEAETIAGGVKESAPGAYPQDNPRVLRFKPEHHELTIDAPRAVKAGPIAAMLRVKSAEAGKPGHLELSLDGRWKSDASVSVSSGFTWIQVAGRTEGSIAPRLRLLFKSGGDVLIDQAVFQSAGDYLPLPEARPSKAPGQISILHVQTSAALAAAAEIKSRLDSMGIPAASPKLAGGVTPMPDGAYILCCESWNDPEALRLLPSWASQTVAASYSKWTVKPAGVLGEWPALGLLPGGLEKLPSQTLKEFAERGTAKSGVSDIQESGGSQIPQIENALESGDFESLARAWMSPDRQMAVAAADKIWELAQSPETLGPIPDALLRLAPAAFGNWLSRSGEWELSQEERILYGELFARIARESERSLKPFLEKSPGQEILSPIAVRSALALYWFGRGFGAGGAAEAAQWRKTGESLLAQAPNRAFAESTRGRIQLAGDLWDFHSQNSSAPLGSAREIHAGIEGLIAARGRMIAIGAESPVLDSSELNDLALSPAARNVLEQQANPGARVARIDPAPGAAPLLAKRTTNPFDKETMAWGGGLRCVIDGLSGGPGGPENAGAILEFAAQDVFWMGGGGAAAIRRKEQNSPSVMIDGEPVELFGSADLEAELAGARSALCVVSLSGENNTKWTRAAFGLSDPEALIVIDEIRPGQRRSIEANCRWRLLGNIEPTADGFALSQKDQRLHINQLDRGRAAVFEAPGHVLNAWKPYLSSLADGGPLTLATRWAGDGASPSDPIVFRHSFAIGKKAPEARPLRAKGVRLDGSAAFLGDVAEPGFKFTGAAASFQPDEILLSGASLLEFDKQWISSGANVNLTLDLRQGSIIVSPVDRATQVAIQLVPGAKVEGGPQPDSQGIVRLSVAPGRNVFNVGADDLAPLFAAAKIGIESLVAGHVGAFPSLTQQQKGFAQKPIASFKQGEMLAIETATGLDGSSGFVASTAAGELAWTDASGTKSVIALGAPSANAILPIDLDLDGVLEIAVGCADGAARVYSLAGDFLGETALGLGAVRFLDEADIESDGLPEMIAAADNGLAILDVIGRLKGKQEFTGKPVVLEIGSLGKAAECSAVIATDRGERFFLRIANDGKISAQAFPISTTSATAAAFVDLNADGTDDAVAFGDSEGIVEVFSANASNVFAKIWSRTLGEDSIEGIAGCPGGAKGRLFVASRSGFVAALAKDASVEWLTYLDSGAVSFSSSKSKSNESEWLAATTSGGLYAIDLKGTVHAFGQLSQPVSAIRVPMSFNDGSFFAASETSVSSISRLD